jgi:hypothetical protein
MVFLHWLLGWNVMDHASSIRTEHTGRQARTLKSKKGKERDREERRVYNKEKEVEW